MLILFAFTQQRQFAVSNIKSNFWQNFQKMTKTNDKYEIQQKKKHVAVLLPGPMTLKPFATLCQHRVHNIGLWQESSQLKEVRQRMSFSQHHQYSFTKTIYKIPKPGLSRSLEDRPSKSPNYYTPALEATFAPLNLGFPQKLPCLNAVSLRGKQTSIEKKIVQEQNHTPWFGILSLAD